MTLRPWSSFRHFFLLKLQRSAAIEKVHKFYNPAMWTIINITYLCIIAKKSVNSSIGRVVNLHPLVPKRALHVESTIYYLVDSTKKFSQNHTVQ